MSELLSSKELAWLPIEGVDQPQHLPTVIRVLSGRSVGSQKGSRFLQPDN